DLVPQPQDTAKLAELFERLEFKTWKRELEERGAKDEGRGTREGGREARGEGRGNETGASSAAGPARGNEQNAAPVAPRPLPPRKYETILAESDLAAWVERISNASLVAIDTETTSLDPFTARLVGISLSVEPNHAAYIPVGHNYAGAPAQLPLDRVFTALKVWMQSAKHRKVGQNLKYDRHVFANHGIFLAGIEHDTLLQSYVLESHQPHDMDSLASRHLRLDTISYDEVTGKGANRIPFEQVSVDRATEYS